MILFKINHKLRMKTFLFNLKEKARLWMKPNALYEFGGGS